jgi:hypothetical protein
LWNKSNNFIAFIPNLSIIVIYLKQMIEIYFESLYNECLIWFLHYMVYDILKMFNKSNYDIVSIINWGWGLNYKFSISILNWLYYNYFQFRIEIENNYVKLSLEDINLFKEFYFISSLFQYKLEKSYLNYDLNRLNVFNFWAEEYFVTQTPLTIQTWKPRYRRKVPGAHEQLFKYAGSLNFISSFYNGLNYNDLIIGQKQNDFGIKFIFWYNFLKNYQKINESYVEPFKFKIAFLFNEWVNAHKTNFIFFFKNMPINFIRRRRFGRHIHLNLHFISFKINYMFLTSESYFINEFFWLFLKNFNSRVIMFSTNVGQTNLLNILESFGVDLKKYSIYLKWFCYDYIEVFDIYWSIFPYYKWIFYYQYLLIYIIAFWVLNLMYFFRNILYCPITSINSEYSWKKFRDSDLLDLFWMFKGINKKVKNYLSNPKNTNSKEYSNNMFEDEVSKLYENLVYVGKHADGYEFFNAPQADSRFISIPRTKWLIKASRMLRERSHTRLFELNFNFINFYQNLKYENFYNNLVANHLQVGGFLAYGLKRNVYIKQANFGEAEGLEPLPVFFNARYVDSKEIFDGLKAFFWKMDKVLYKESLPYWSLHKDMFSYQLSGINDAESNSKQIDDITEDEKERKVLDNRYFIVDEDPHDFYYITFWFFFIPLTLFLAVYWKHNWLGFFSSRKVFDFFLYDYLSHFDLIREFSNSIGSNYFIGETSWWKFGSYYAASKPRMRKKRHFSFRPLMEGFTMIGEYMIWEAKIFVSRYYSVNILLVFRSLYEFLIYFLIISFFLFIRGLLFGKKLLFLNIEKGALLHQNKFVKLFLKVNSYIALNYYLKSKNRN